MRPDADDLGAEAKIGRAAELRKQGFTWRVIAAELGYESPSTLSRRVHEYIRGQVKESVQDLVDVEKERLEGVMVAFYAQMQAGDKEAAKIFLQAVAQHSRLFGLEDAKRKEVEQMGNELTGEQAANVVGALTRIFAALNLSEDQRAMLSTIVPREMGRVTREQAAIEGEVVDDDTP